ncbi:ABC transporter ATP-binding protein [Bacillus sp. HMF5848]|uniref:ABC transporter ATP-binding protein n=1 Tax=Bacillus sp. HMF5848 TaxID=2495421 RepID=UPI000F78055B|nr:ABC transporter ATP-binding protein [Bacillus sp. HMF5848]RSK27355.1 ABC transporter ATP-binding protein [Bacillus sp. HMF5848]
MLLEIKKLSKTFGGLKAVQNVDFVIEEGKITAIIGPNGAGKSTFFNLLSGFIQPTSGQILFNGKDITSLKSNQIAKIGMGRTFQTTNLFADSTVLDNVIIGYRLRTKSNLFDAILRTKREKREEAQALKKALSVLEFTDLLHLKDKYVRSIPQEAQKRVAIALALATDPVIILLDEPAAGVNPDETVGLTTLIRKIADSGVSVCIIEHKMQMIMSLADKIMVLNQGEKIAEGAPEEISKNKRVIEAYLGGAVHANAQ